MFVTDGQGGIEIGLVTQAIGDKRLARRVAQGGKDSLVGNASSSYFFFRAPWALPVCTGHSNTIETSPARQPVLRKEAALQFLLTVAIKYLSIRCRARPVLLL